MWLLPAWVQAETKGGGYWSPSAGLAFEDRGVGRLGCADGYSGRAGGMRGLPRVRGGHGEGIGGGVIDQAECLAGWSHKKTWLLARFFCCKGSRLRIVQQEEKFAAAGWLSLVENCCHIRLGGPDITSIHA